MVRTRFAAALVAAVLAACSGTPEKPDTEVEVPGGPLTVGVTTPTGAADAAKDADALASALAGALGRPVTAQVFGKYDELVAAVSKGSVDLAWMPPLTFVKASREAEVTPLRMATRNGNAMYKAVIFTRADKPYGSPADLKGAKMAWVSETSSSGYLFPKALLIEAGLAPEKLFADQQFLGDHEAVCKAVVDGTADAGATFTDDVAAGNPNEVTACKTVLATGGAGLKILTATDPMPSDVIAARPGLSGATRDDVGKALDRLASTPDAAKVFGKLFNADGFKEVGEKDFEPVKRAMVVLEPVKPKD